ncbi:hypothetical protein NDU88_007397 [Pleurodeles waltl]|uniref:Uncharacterized protein n=1 Tax=Pleurodeles waltl TaxID=8319 RepID=A0AAV7NSZ3_PLEWA|nr:hypothetical protein NDU88_007397 [Pleurodeles waltl]
MLLQLPMAEGVGSRGTKCSQRPSTRPSTHGSPERVHHPARCHLSTTGKSETQAQCSAFRRPARRGRAAASRPQDAHTLTAWV